MDAGPVAKSKPAPSWKLSARVAPDIQGFIASGFKGLPTGLALFLEFGWAATQPVGWLDRLCVVAPITNAVSPSAATSPDSAASIAFSATGLMRMGLPAQTFGTFSRPFVEGMFQEDRLRRIGDRRDGKWCETVVKDGPIWSANAPVIDPAATAGTFADPTPPDQSIATAITVHAMLLLYTLDDASADAWARRVETCLADDGVAVVRRLPLLLDVQRQDSFSREHFGFADGLSQPIPYDGGGAVQIGGRPATAQTDPVQNVPLGEIVLGYVNGHGEKAPGPIVCDKTAAATLPASVDAEGCFDLGLNGSYLVVRELEQNVAAFKKSMEDNAAAIRTRDPKMEHVTGDWLASRVIGRDKDGHLLCPGNTLLPACVDNSPDSSFLFIDKGRDPDGVGCPPGSHVRRAFPRDALAPKPQDGSTLLQAANNHRILRRGRKFGPIFADDTKDDSRGLLFMCLNTDIERQFEFVQQTWLLNSSFATLFEEVDPLLGPAGPMTIRDTPLRHIAHVDTFVRMAGGDYFFLPGLPALRYLASL